jgi:hypothetical protein
MIVVDAAPAASITAGQEEAAGWMLIANRITPPRSGCRDSHPGGSTQREHAARHS